MRVLRRRLRTESTQSEELKEIPLVKVTRKTKLADLLKSSKPGRRKV